VPQTPRVFKGSLPPPPPEGFESGLTVGIDTRRRLLAARGLHFLFQRDIGRSRTSRTPNPVSASLRVGSVYQQALQNASNYRFTARNRADRPYRRYEEEGRTWSRSGSFAGVSPTPPTAIFAVTDEY